MSRETEQRYLGWLAKQLPDAKYLYVGWYGGEPLLSKGTIGRLTDGILRMRERFGFEYSASVVTNGVLLDRQFSEQADSLGVKSVQVTLDGVRAVQAAVPSRRKLQLADLMHQPLIAKFTSKYFRES